LPSDLQQADGLFMKAFQDLAFVAPFLPLVIPAWDLQAKENAENNGDNFHHDSEPVLLAKFATDTAKYHAGLS